MPNWSGTLPFTKPSDSWLPRQVDAVRMFVTRCALGDEPCFERRAVGEDPADPLDALAAPNLATEEIRDGEVNSVAMV